MTVAAAGTPRLLRALRMDDVGASSKRYEVYSTWRVRRGPLLVDGNWLLLKYLPPFQHWGPYRELTARDWLAILQALERSDARLTVAVTAGWVNADGTIVPFPVKHPSAAAVIREGVEQGLLEVANHGYTHCVLKDRAFRPRLFSSNRQYHREFWPWVPEQVQDAHIRMSQDILSRWIRRDIVTFVPPGNVFADFTLELARKYGLRHVSCSAAPADAPGLTFVDPATVVGFHDRDLVRGSIDWLHTLLAANAGYTLSFVKTLAARSSEASHPVRTTAEHAGER
jgi:peptidoglycan/xylan/chitin deacetylase (PgdA/CDA1 family)